jgi:hypothetical protein
MGEEYYYFVALQDFALAHRQISPMGWCAVEADFI